MAAVTKALRADLHLNSPLPARCPKCGTEPFDVFMRGKVYSFWRGLFRRPSWALICWPCHEIVGWER